MQRRLCGAASASWDAGLDAALFESSQEVWALRLPERECGRAMDALRDHVLRLPRIRSIQPDPNGSGFRRLLLAPPDADSADADAVSAPQRPAPGRRRGGECARRRHRLLRRRASRPSTAGHSCGTASRPATPSSRMRRCAGGAAREGGAEAALSAAGAAAGAAAAAPEGG